MGSTVQEFFEDIEKNSKEGTTLPVWYVNFLLPSLLLTYHGVGKGSCTLK
jgi:hypothetical protein